MIIGRKYHFDSSHHLPDYNGPCERLHGHTYTLKIELQGSIDENSGMVMDYHRLNDIVGQVLAMYDHQNLNDILDMPTCENLLNHIRNRIESHLPNNIRIQTLQLHEGEGGWARC